MATPKPATRPSPNIGYCLLGALFLPLAFFGGFLLFKMYEFNRHHAVSEKMNLAILRLSVVCPPGLTEDQWAYCITWTWMMHGNYGSVPSYVPTDELDRIGDELNHKIDHGADLTTIDWIWDEYIKAYPRVRVFNHYRPTSAENKEQLRACGKGKLQNGYLSKCD